MQTTATPAPASAPAGHPGILAAIGGLFHRLWDGLLHLFGDSTAPASPSPSPAPASPPPPSNPGAGGPKPPATYTVAPGDSLSGIAAKVLGSASRWNEIYQLNRGQIANPNLIYPGQVLKLPTGASAPPPVPPPAPAPAPGGSYTVAPGDTLSGIAARALGNAARWPEIYQLNRGQIANPNVIHPGEVLRLPAGASIPTASPASAPGGSVGQWISEAFAVLEANGVPAGELDANDVAIIIQHESAGNPNAINNRDSNAKAGHPSEGLMQTIGPTFDAYALGSHTDIFNPVDNIIAAVRYALARYGSLSNVPGIVSMARGGPYVGY